MERLLLLISNLFCPRAHCGLLHGLIMLVYIRVAPMLWIGTYTSYFTSYHPYCVR